MSIVITQYVKVYRLSSYNLQGLFFFTNSVTYAINETRLVTYSLILIHWVLIHINNKRLNFFGKFSTLYADLFRTSGSFVYYPNPNNTY